MPELDSTTERRASAILYDKADKMSQTSFISWDHIVYVHHTIEQKEFNPCGDRVLGVDKGCSEAFADSDGDFHGTKLGEVLSQATKKRHTRDYAQQAAPADEKNTS